MKFDFEEIRQALRARVREVCEHLLPGGHEDKGKWIEARKSEGGFGDSLQVELSGPKLGMFFHHAADRGGDLIDLWVYVKGLPDEVAAFKEAGVFLGCRVLDPSENSNFKDSKVQTSEHTPAAGAPAPLDRGDQKKEKPKKQWGKLVAAYDYRDAEGRLVHQTLRYDPKDFMQRRPAAEGMSGGNKTAKKDRDGKWWLWTLAGIEPVLYRLPEVLADGSAGEPVWICEGEKDANTLAELGAVSTTCAMGAGKWRPSYTAVLTSRPCKRVFILLDWDKTGRAGQEKVAQELMAAGLEVWEIDWSQVREAHPTLDWDVKVDVTDLVEALMKSAG